MFNPFKKLFTGFTPKTSKSTPALFAELFPRAMSVEWTETNEILEAIFYQDEMEHIARFDLIGHLIDYKINLTLDSIPLPIRTIAEQHGEVMNGIAIYKDNGLEAYEIIFRDKELKRYTMLLTKEEEIKLIREL
jgi:hypothetical protein